ncbi:MAG: Hpt domain-containing protein [Terriglobia bacterium]
MAKELQESYESNAIFDRRAALSHVEGDEELLEELARIFLREFPGMMQKLREAVSRKDPRAIAVEAHTLKGAIANFGSAGAVKEALAVEQMGREENLSGLHEAFARLESKIALLKSALARLAKEPVFSEA